LFIVRKKPLNSEIQGFFLSVLPCIPWPAFTASGQISSYRFFNPARLAGKTLMASAVMPYCTISYGIDKTNKENVGNSYNKYLIGDLLRRAYSFDGVVCTDWGITKDEKAVNSFGTTPWGAETLTVAQRHYKIIMAGADQFGGNNEAGPVIEAYNMGVKEHGEKFMRARMEQSAVRLLKNIFRVGLFENPYLDIAETRSVVGNPDFMKEGYDARLKSVVMLKNKGKALPIQKNKTVYVPKRFTPASQNFFGDEIPASLAYPINISIVKKFFRVTDNPAEADVALVVISSPDTGSGYDPADAAKGGAGYVPISLQYGLYKAVYARDPSIVVGGRQYQRPEDGFGRKESDEGEAGCCRRQYCQTDDLR
jgi:beta-glucosidase